MKVLTLQDLLPYQEYERGRGAYRQRIIELKKRRRIPVGDLITLIFENRDTVLFQIQEMIRTERIFEPQKVQEELDVYNSLLPASEELSATLFIEITDPERTKELLDSFQNIDGPDTVKIQAAQEYVYGDFETGHSNEDKLSAVHFIRFRLQSKFLEGLMAKRSPVTIQICHPRYQAEAQVPDDMRHEWLLDLGFQDSANDMGHF